MAVPLSSAAAADERGRTTITTSAMMALWNTAECVSAWSWCMVISSLLLLRPRCIRRRETLEQLGNPLVNADIPFLRAVRQGFHRGPSPNRLLRTTVEDVDDQRADPVRRHRCDR